ncbi:MAG TPA: hypothetical protein VK453_16660 [Micromonosporaceae bacterium]|nr:hypothetical protein [Micromonosporaceae bacterium]
MKQLQGMPRNDRYSVKAKADLVGGGALGSQITTGARSSAGGGFTAGKLCVGSDSSVVGRGGSKSAGLLTVARLAAGASAILGAEFATNVGLQWPLRQVLVAVALALLPVDALPILVIFSFRYMDPVAGPLFISDVISLVYLARLLVSGRLMALQVTHSRIALAMFLVWATAATVLGVGVLSALGRLTLYAAVGLAINHRLRARRYVIGGVVGLALIEVICYLPSMGERMTGVFVADPAQVGFLLLAALVLVFASRLSPSRRVALGLPLLAGVAATMTRTVWFALVVVAIAACLPRRWYVPLILPPALAAVTLPFVPLITASFGLNRESLEIRQQSIQLGYSAFLDRPGVGHGWASSSKLVEGGLVGFVNTSAYNLWIFLGTSTGLVGLILFALFIGSLGREALDHTTAYLTIVAFLAIALTEMPLYAGSLIALLFFALTAVPRVDARLSGTGGVSALHHGFRPK